MNTDGRVILIVEDEPLIRFALSDCLMEFGFSVLEAKDVLSAVAVFGKVERIDAVITDVDMPGHLSGLDLASLVVGRSANIPVVLTTGRTREECGELCAQVHYLSKPYDEREIVSILNAHFAQNCVSEPRKCKAR